jgi:Phospholipid-translocating ATPase N-terminal
MADDFARLVSQANPAAALDPQYQRANNGYPPSARPRDFHASTLLLDPFFDDEDEGEVPDSAFGGVTAQAKESKLNLPGQAAPLAGASKSSLTTDDVPQGWTFDQDDPPIQAPQSSSRESNKVSRRRWKWPWQKEQILTGERVIALNNPEANAYFLSNYVSTAKYNMMTFIPKFLFGWPLPLLLALLLLVADDALICFQSNSLNMPIYFSFSPRAFNKFQVSHLPTSGPPSHPCLSSSSRLHSRSFRKISCVT